MKNKSVDPLGGNYVCYDICSIRQGTETAVSFFHLSERGNVAHNCEHRNQRAALSKGMRTCVSVCVQPQQPQAKPPHQIILVYCFRPISQSKSATNYRKRVCCASGAVEGKLLLSSSFECVCKSVRMLAYQLFLLLFQRSSVPGDLPLSTAELFRLFLNDVCRKCVKKKMGEKTQNYHKVEITRFIKKIKQTSAYTCCCSPFGLM